MLSCLQTLIGHVMFLNGLISAGLKSSDPLHLLRLNGHVGLSDKGIFVCHHSLCWGIYYILFQHFFPMLLHFHLYIAVMKIFLLLFLCFYTGHFLFSQCGLTAVHLIDRYIYVKVIEVREVCSRKKGARGGLYPPPPIF